VEKKRTIQADTILYNSIISACVKGAALGSSIVKVVVVFGGKNGKL